MTYRSKTRVQKVEYMQALLRELRDMAAIERCELLTYFIEMAYAEAGDIVRAEVKKKAA